MRNGWTGGQYSLFRGLFGLYLFIHFTYLAFWAPDIFSNEGMLPDAALSPLIVAFPNILGVIDTPGFVVLLCVLAALASVFFAVGKWDKIAAVFLWFVLACFLGRNPLIINPAMPYVGWMLLAHLFIPKAPYGSWAARGRVDPGNGWEFPKEIFLAAWIILALTYSYSGYTKLLSPSWVAGENIAYVLDNPLARDWFLRDIFLALPPVLLMLLTWFILAIELFFAPLCLIARLRPWLWLGMFFVQFGFAFLLNFPDLTFAMLLFHMMTFDPNWLRAKSMEGARLYYDGGCGLCHGVVKFILSEDTRGELTFKPLQDGELEETMGKEAVADLGDTIVLKTAENETLTKMAAVVYVLDRLGGFWRVASWPLRILPTSVGNWLYKFVGDRRYRIFGQVENMCPILPVHLRQRFK